MGGGGGEGCRGRGKQWNEVRPHSAQRDEKLTLTANGAPMTHLAAHFSNRPTTSASAEAALATTFAADLKAGVGKLRPGDHTRPVKFFLIRPAHT